MKSALPKVLHPLAHKSLVSHVIDTVNTLSPEQVTLVVGHGADRVKASITQQVTYVEQTEQLGTAHAVSQATGTINDDDTVVVAYGDVPLTSAETFAKLHALASPTQIGLLTVTMDDPHGYGRIVRDTAGKVTGIVEQKDATDEQRAIREINSGMLSANGAVLKTLLSQVDNQNAQNEYYLTDIFKLGVAAGHTIATVQPDHEWEVAGVNSRTQLAELERIHQLNIANELMESGVTLRDPARIDVRGQLDTGMDCSIDVNTIFEGHCRLADNVSIGPNCVLINANIGPGTTVHANTIIENATVSSGCSVGPFARLRPGTELGDGARIGNFVETKNAVIGLGSKVNHLSYVGDSDVGNNVNVGAGTITCNYDGANKHRTVMEDDVFIGSNTALVAPVTVGRGATVAAGAVIARDVSANVLAVARTKQKEITNWERPVKNKKTD